MPHNSGGMGRPVHRRGRHRGGLGVPLAEPAGMTTPHAAGPSPRHQCGHGRGYPPRLVRESLTFTAASVMSLGWTALPVGLRLLIGIRAENCLDGVMFMLAGEDVG